ncbi:MAG: SGNH/GDSL hydrolase family protein [Candidatus Micrarchaeota archaeon]|nr:SGNH/GDSL hydrolase family protein [Candidatus Micrarchaeota archaeon]
MFWKSRKGGKSVPKGTVGEYMVAIGDSTTAGTNSTFITPISQDNYAAYLAKRMGYRLSNLAYPLATSRSALSQAQRMQEIAKHRGKKASLATIMIGANDVFRNRSPNEFEENLGKIISSAKQCSKRVVVLGLPDLRHFGGIRSRSAPLFHAIYGTIGMKVSSPATWKKFDQFDRIIRRVSKRHKAYFVDVHAHAFQKEDLGVDRLHVGRRGHVRISEYIYKMLAKK